jgi:hypothetical protein
LGHSVFSEHSSCQSAAGPPCLGGAEGWAPAGRLGVYSVRIPFRERQELNPEFYWDIPYFQNTLVAKAQPAHLALEAQKAGRVRADWVSTVCYVSPSESVESYYNMYAHCARAGGHDYGNNHRSRASFSELENGDFFVIIG